jgi:hypothetical protein
MPTRLHYDRLGGAEACPDEAQLRDAISARLGSDPFSDDGKRLLEITIGPHGNGLEARIDVVAEGGATSGRRDLRSQSRDCDDLATVLVLTASMVLEPPPAPHPPPPAVSEPAVEPPRKPVVSHEPEAVTAVAAAPAAQAPTETGGVQVELATAGEFGALSSPSLAFTLGLGYAWSSFTLSVEGQANLPVQQALSTGSVTSSQLTATLVPCLTQWHLGACGLVSAGATRVSASGISPEGHQSLPFFALGARLYWGLPLEDWLEARILADLLVPLTQTSIVLNQSTTWSAAPISGSVGLALVTRFR